MSSDTAFIPICPNFVAAANTGTIDEESETCIHCQVSRNSSIIDDHQKELDETVYNGFIKRYIDNFKSMYDVFLPQFKQLNKGDVKHWIVWSQFDSLFELVHETKFVGFPYPALVKLSEENEFEKRALKVISKLIDEYNVDEDIILFVTVNHNPIKKNEATDCEQTIVRITNYGAQQYIKARIEKQKKDFYCVENNTSIS